MMALKNLASILPLGLVLACGLPAHAVDITALLREAGNGSYVAALDAGTTAYTGEGNRGLTNAFDGITTHTDDAYRLLITKGTGVVPCAITYTIPDSVMPDYDFRLNTIVVYPLSCGWGATNRSVSAFRLEGRNGMDAWKTIYETPEPELWASNTAPRTFTIPEANRRCYRSYRFVATHVADGSYVGLEELQLWGDVERRLIWNGSDGATWNATDLNWVDASGVATNWIPGAKAVFGESGSTNITVQGTNDVGGIVFTAPTACTVSGGTLAVAPPAEILLGGGEDVLATEFADAKSVDVYDGTSYFPADPANTKQGRPILLWRNMRLSSITNFTGARILQSGTRREATPYHFVNNGNAASAQFQTSYYSSSNDKYATLCIKVILTQEGADIYGRVAYVYYSWSAVGGSSQIGSDYDQAVSGRGSMMVYDGVISTSGYGFYGIMQEGGEMFDAQPVAVRAAYTQVDYTMEYGAGYLPTNESNPNTGDPVLYFPGFKVKDMKSVYTGELYNVEVLRPTSYHYFTNDGTTASVQLQGNSDARLCVKVEFTDGEGGVYARAVYGDYNWDNKNAQDFDERPSHAHDALIYSNGQKAPAYGVKKLGALFTGGDHLTLGTPSLTLDREFVGDGTIRFAPLSGSQTVTVPELRTFGKVAFGGATAFAFADGASISADSADVEEGATVSLMGALGGMFMRIGTEKCLTAAELVHFTVNGYEAVQKAEGWIMPKKGISILLR
ncbi:MAG: hypothetical protein IKO72_01280 [Kiritimatiellae bacterium]|nr:hypothetical protein [Kiritimatiellia bacterium]